MGFVEPDFICPAHTKTEGKQNNMDQEERQAVNIDHELELILALVWLHKIDIDDGIEKVNTLMKRSLEAIKRSIQEYDDRLVAYTDNHMTINGIFKIIDEEQK